MKKTDKTLFIILASLSMLMLVQGLTHALPLELSGYTQKPEQVRPTFQTCRDASYQGYLSECAKHNGGFRELFIRLYNQYLWTCFSKTNCTEVVRGKDNWFFYPENVNDYYGTEMYRWQPTAEIARETYDREARLMYKLRAILKEYDVEFLMFMAPEKGRLYPEHLPDRDFDTTTVDALAYYEAKFNEYDFPYIEMTRWFQTMKDTMPYSLIPQAGAHWGFSSVVAADSLFRFMGTLKGQPLHHLCFGPLHKSDRATTEGDCDLGNMLNLVVPVRHDNDILLDAKVTVEADASTERPSALFVGNSYLWRMIYYIPFDEVFSHSEYWFYNSTAYYGKDFRETRPVPGIDILQKVINSDYVVWFTTGAQMYKVSYGFVEKALMDLCLSNERRDEVRIRLMDSLSTSYGTTDTIRLWQEANMMLISNPEKWFPELAGDSIPTLRNPRLADVLAQRSMDRHPAMTDSIVGQLKAWIRTRPDMMKVISQKAQAKGISEDESLDRDVRWMVIRKIKDGEIVYPD